MAATSPIVIELAPELTRQVSTPADSGAVDAFAAVFRRGQRPTDGGDNIAAGVCGRLLQGNLDHETENFVRLTGDPAKRFSWVSGSDALSAMSVCYSSSFASGFPLPAPLVLHQNVLCAARSMDLREQLEGRIPDGRLTTNVHVCFMPFLDTRRVGMKHWQCLRLVGMERDWVEKKLAQNRTFRLALFPAAAAVPATWDGIFSLLPVAYPSVASKILQHAEAVRSRPYAELQAEYGHSWIDVDMEKTKHPQYLNVDRLEAMAFEDVTPAHARAFLYFIFGLKELFVGDGCVTARACVGRDLPSTSVDELMLPLPAIFSLSARRSETVLVSSFACDYRMYVVRAACI